MEPVGSDKSVKTAELVLGLASGKQAIAELDLSNGGLTAILR
jgi:hypothetical protein